MQQSRKILFAHRKKYKDQKLHVGELLGGGKEHNISGPPVSVLIHPHRRRVFSIYPNSFPCNLWEQPPTLLWHTSYSSTNHLRSWTFSSLLISLLTAGGSSAGHKITDGLPQIPSRRGKTHFPPLLDFRLFLIQPSMQLTFVATRLHCWFPFNLFSTRTPRSFCRATAQPVCPQPTLRHWVILSQMQGFALVFVELWEASVLLQFEVPLNGSPAPWHISHSPRHLVSTTNLDVSHDLAC